MADLSMTVPRYQGDAALIGLLRKAGARFGASGELEDLKDLIRGVLGAAVPRDPAAWCRLVVPEPAPDLVGQLLALKALIAAEAVPAADAASRLARVRDGMVRLGIDAFLVPRADEYQNEYVPACNERLAWLTGFTGSAGFAVVLADRAALFVDGRYTDQAAAQTDPALYEHHHLITDPPEGWLSRVLTAGQAVGYDSWLMTPAQIERFAQAASRAGARLVAVEWNPLDAAWTGRPAQPLAPVNPHPLELAGQSSADKRQAIAAALAAERRDGVVITAADSLAWLLNIRGGDVPHTPLALGFALVDRSGAVDLFIDHRKLAPGLESHLGNGVAIHPPEALGAALDRLGNKTIQLDPATAAGWIQDRLSAAGASVVKASDPCTLPKAMKNPVELAGARAAHRRDGIAMTRFLGWLDQAAPAGGLSEIAASDQLEQFRAAGAGFRDLSFDSISAAGPSAALPHYRASPDSQRVIEPDSLYLIDSGGQYQDGTTDITRTVAVGTPSALMRDRYTRVLKGHIAIARAVFPVGTTGHQIDALARLALWQAGADYDHGTGHGVGSYLSVHEGPARIAAAANTQALKPGMILSNEPGYYRPGAFGIRIENLVVVTPVTIPNAEREMLGFETITFCPIDLRPVEPGLMDPGEIAWLDAYHEQVRATLLPDLDDPAARAWLLAATRPLAEALAA